MKKAIDIHLRKQQKLTRKHNILIVFALLILLMGCNHRKHKSTIKQFTKMYFDSLTRRHPDVSFSIIDDSTIKSQTKDEHALYSSYNAYKAYLLDTSAIASILSRYTSAMEEAFKAEKSHQEIDRSKILPVIKPAGYIDDMLNGMKKLETDSNKNIKKDNSLICEGYNDQLIILYVEDNNSTMKFLYNSDLENMCIGIDSLHHLAIQNLKNNLPDIQYVRGKGLSMPIAGADYDASLILRPGFITKKNFPVNGDLVVAIPSRDVLLVTGSKEEEGIKKIIELTAKQFSKGDHTISGDLFKWNGTKFEKYNLSP